MASSDPPAVDVAGAAELTGLSKDAIRSRIRRRTLASYLRNGRHLIPVAELQRHGLLVAGGRYRSLRKRAEALEAQLSAAEARLRAALESREQMQQELGEAEGKVRMVWSMAQQRNRELAALRSARRKRWRLRWPFRRSTPRASTRRRPSSSSMPAKPAQSRPPGQSVTLP